MISKILLISNPFFESYIHSDFLGKLIFMGLITLSILSWGLIFYKTWQTLQAKKASSSFKKIFDKQKNIFALEADPFPKNPFKELYSSLKKVTLELLNKNRHFIKSEIAYLSQGDVEFVEASLVTAVSKESKSLEKNLYLLSTVVTLAPFLGLLGTVWGILITFSELQMQSGNSHQTVLNGLSLALATTVLGLIDAIPALIGYNYLKNAIRDFETDMLSFARELIANIEMSYRKVEF